MPSLERAPGGFPKETRKLLIAKSLELPFRYEFREVPPGSLAKAEAYLANGYGLIGLAPHFSNGDFVRVVEALFKNSRKFREKDMLAPIAQHQEHYPGIQEIASWTNIKLMPIVTPDTKIKEAEIKAKGKPIPWQMQKVGYGSLPYLQRAMGVLQKGGIVLLSPQAGRQGTLKPFEGKPVGHLNMGTRRTGIKKVAFFFIGLEILGLDDYSKARGLNLFKKYVVTFGNVLTREELHAQAEKNGRTIDQEVYHIMLDLAPQAYRPRDL